MVTRKLVLIVIPSDDALLISRCIGIDESERRPTTSPEASGFAPLSEESP